MKHDLHGDFGRCTIDAHDGRAGMAPTCADVGPDGSARENAAQSSQEGPPAADSGFEVSGEGPRENALCAPPGGLPRAMAQALEERTREFAARPSPESARAILQEALNILEAMRLLRKYGALEDQGIGLTDKADDR